MASLITRSPESARKPFTGRAVWHGRDLIAAGDWIWPLDGAAIAEIDAALATAKALRPEWRAMTRADFPLPGLGPTLARLDEELEHGRGVVRLRGLPVARYDEDDLRRIFWGLGLHLGQPRPQNARGEMIGEVRDEVRAFGRVRHVVAIGGDGRVPLSSRARARSSGALRFHTDRADVTALLCVRPAAAGGVSQIVSALAVHNAILARRPDLLECLYGDYHRSRLGEEAGGEAQAYALPVFATRDGRFTTQYSRTFVEAAQAIPGVPPLSPDQDEALDLHAALCHELCAEAPFAPGDIQIFNNHVVYHARTAYRDDDDSDRLLFRLWLAVANSRALPAGHEVLWGRIDAGAIRGGIDQAVDGESGGH